MTTMEQDQEVDHGNNGKEPKDSALRRFGRSLVDLIVSRPNPNYGYRVVGIDDFPAHTLPPDATPEKVAEMLDKFEEVWPAAISSLQQVPEPVRQDSIQNGEDNQ